MTVKWKQPQSSTLSSFQQLQQQFPKLNRCDAYSEQAAKQFRFKVPSGFLENGPLPPNSALLAQVFPDARETIDVPGYITDPVGDLSAMQTPGLIHKYRNRALFIVTGACAIHCRYCFRRHFPYSDSQINQENWEPAFNYLRQHSEISEIILSGGDPLIISDDKLERLLSELEAIDHIKRLRIHSRIPSVLPERLNSRCLSLLINNRFQTSLVTHINHADELNRKNDEVFTQLKTSPVQLLNQSVLLAGVNDNANSLIELSEKLYENGILPYYLHMLDPVQGAAHFSVKEADAIALIEEITTRLPGYLVPKLVKEIAGEKAKTRIL